MNKVTLILMFLVVCSAPSFAFGLGARAMAMGGAYTALADDITAAYWNPAGLVHGDVKPYEAMIGEGIDANFGFDKVAGFTNPKRLVRDYWGKDADFSGSVNGICGFSVNKIGVSYIPWANVSFLKNAANTEIDFEGVTSRALALTFGGTLNAPWPLFSRISLGANVRYVYGELYRIENAGLKVSNATGQGVGLDLGAQADLMPNVKAGVAFRNILAGFQWSGTTTTYPGYDLAGRLLPASGRESFDETDKSPAHIVLGIAGDIPAVALVSMDLEFADPYNDVHLGVEKKLFMDILALRAGYYTENAAGTSKVTYGCGIDLKIIRADLAVGQDNMKSDDKILVMTASAAI